MRKVTQEASKYIKECYIYSLVYPIGLLFREMTLAPPLSCLFPPFSFQTSSGPRNVHTIYYNVELLYLSPFTNISHRFSAGVLNFRLFIHSFAQRYNNTGLV